MSNQALHSLPLTLRKLATCSPSQMGQKTIDSNTTLSKQAPGESYGWVSHVESHKSDPLCYFCTLDNGGQYLNCEPKPWLGGAPQLSQSSPAYRGGSQRRQRAFRVLRSCGAWNDDVLQSLRRVNTWSPVCWCSLGGVKRCDLGKKYVTRGWR